MDLKRLPKKIFIDNKDEKILYFLRNYICHNHRDNIITLSYNQIAKHVTKHTDFTCTPKQAKRYMYIFSCMGLVVLIAKPRKKKRLRCIGRAKSIYVVSDIIEKDGKKQIKWNALEKTLKLEQIDMFDKQIIGKLTMAEFLAYFQFNFSLLKKFKKFFIEVLCKVYNYYKNSADYLTYTYNIYRYAYIVYPSFFMEIFEDVLKSIKLPTSEQYLEVLNGS
jgi:hypothetical protein